jgi:hypothetical protein
MNKSFFNMAFLTLLLLLCAQEPVAQGFAARLKAAQEAKQAQEAQEVKEQQVQQTQTQPQEAAPTPVAAPLIEEKKAETPPPPPPKTGYHSYEAYLDSIELIAKSLLPGRLTLDSMKYVVSSGAGTEKGKQIKTEYLENQHKAKEKKVMDKLSSTIRLSKDIQPEWEGMLQQNENETGEYRKRIEKFKEKISDMDVMGARIKSLLVKLNVDESDIEALDKKNMLYVKRMERACELMQNYMLKEEAQVLSTEKKKLEMYLGGYDMDKEEFKVNVKDLSSSVPFDYHGTIKIKPRLAEIIDGEIDDFTASIDYMNYPFTVDGAKVYPGAKKAHIYYENNEVPTTGTFKNIDGFDCREGYAEWATHVDSLLSGKLKYRNLDSSYAMKKVRVGPPFWTPRRIFRATVFTLSVASLGLGYWQDYALKSKTKKANELYSETLKAAIIGDDETAYKQNKRAYEDKVNSVQNSKFARNGFYISAGTFGVAGILSFFF